MLIYFLDYFNYSFLSLLGLYTLGKFQKSCFLLIQLSSLRLLFSCFLSLFTLISLTLHFLQQFLFMLSSVSDALLLKLKTLIREQRLFKQILFLWVISSLLFFKSNKMFAVFDTVQDFIHFILFCIFCRIRLRCTFWLLHLHQWFFKGI